MEGRRLGPADGGDRLPWLEPVEEEEAPARRGSGGIILALAAVLVLAIAAVAAWSWMGEGGATDGRGELIRAPEGDYKVPPSDPGGMEVEGEGDSAFATSEGAEPRAKIDLSAVPEEPIVTAAERPKAGSAPGSADPAGAGTVQLGAFSSQAAANAAWKSLSERFDYLSPLMHGVIPVESDDRTLYRLRASGPGAAAICGRLRVAGETCIALN